MMKAKREFCLEVKKKVFRQNDGVPVLFPIPPLINFSPFCGVPIFFWLNIHHLSFSLIVLFLMRVLK